MDSTAIRVVFGVVAVAVVGFIAYRYLKSLMGYSINGMMRAPQGKNEVDVFVCDNEVLKPYKFGQVFEVSAVSGVQSAIDRIAGGERRGEGAIAFKGKTFGFADSSERYIKALMKLADTNEKVLASPVMYGLENDGRPIVKLLLPHESWFVKALTPNKY
jgi:hypothetical protein